MIRGLVAGAAALMLVGACGGNASSNEREVLVDFSPDDVVTFVAANFPKKVSVLPGDTVAFKQTWTGEPHTVTGGKKVDEVMESGSDLLDLFSGYEELIPDNPDLINPDDPGDATVAEFLDAIRDAKPAAKGKQVVATYERLSKANNWPGTENPEDTLFSDANPKINEAAEELFSALPFAFDDETDNLAQNVSQPCFLETGMPPEDAGRACTKEQQRQPVFDGTQSFYNSGILPYEGARGNTFRMKIAEDTAPGTYFFYCAIHGMNQLSEITVAEEGADVPSASAVRRAGRDEATETVEPFRKTYRDAVRTGKTMLEGEELEGPFAGLPTDIFGSINEFVPKTIKAKVNEPITWKFIGPEHSVSFDVPPYLPIIEFGTRFRLNPKVRDHAGGAPEPPNFDPGPSEDGPPSDEIPSIDGGTYDGEGFWSSGLVAAEPYLNYTLRISKPGNYPYACLIHPKMIGNVVVEA